MPYLLPTDLAEVYRLDFQHYMLRYVLRGNYLAPIGQPFSVLDVGCGTGRWGAELARQFPQANVVGVDVVVTGAERPDARAARQGIFPDNYAFVPGNVLERLPFDDRRFDFVHQRLLFAAIPRPRWPQVVAELARVTRPGAGWSWSRATSGAGA